MSYNTGELQRLLANLIRYGVVTELDTSDPSAPRVKCSTGGLDTDWLPWCAGRAGATRRWSAPRPGEQVVVFSPYGDPAQGFVLPGFYQDAHPAPADSQDKDTTVYPDGSTVEYDSASNTLTVNVAGNGNVVVNCKVATVKADTSVTLDTPEATVTGNLTVQKNLGVVGAMAVQGEGASGAVSTFAGSIQITDGDVTADAISLKGHGHIEQGDGNRTGNAVT